MLVLTRTITCNLPDDGDILELLEAKHKEQPFKDYDDVFQAIQDIILDDTDDEAYDYFFNDIQDYSEDIADTFLESHSEIEY